MLAIMLVTIIGRIFGLAGSTRCEKHEAKVGHWDIGLIVCRNFIWSILNYTWPTLALDNIRLECGFTKHIKRNSYLGNVTNVYTCRVDDITNALIDLPASYLT